MRGLVGFSLLLETGATDVHSGTTGGAARNPLGELMKLVSEMYDASTGKVKIKGFYDDVVAPSRSELADFNGSGFTTKDFGHGFGLHFCSTAMLEMGGKLTVDSRGQGQGATFILSFPGPDA